MPECTERCAEYQQVAALISLDLDLLAIVSRRKNITVDELRKHIQFTIEKRDDLVNNAELREQRYRMAEMLLKLPRENS